MLVIKDFQMVRLSWIITLLSVFIREMQKELTDRRQGSNAMMEGETEI